jgi:signal transduction histidine kinase/ligand-binding sensor domain-containing protein
MKQRNHFISLRIFSYLRHSLFFFCLINAPGAFLQAQELQFNRVLSGGITGDYVLGVAQDKYGFIWLTRQLGGLQRYDGRELKSYHHDPNNPNSPASNYIESFIIDKDNIFWLGTYDAGLDRYDPATNTFTHYPHDENDPSTIISNRINSLLADKAGNIWIGTDKGLDMLDKKTGRFTHYVHNPLNNVSLSNNVVKMIYEDRAGVIWAGCGEPLDYLPAKAGDGGLNRLNKTTGKFTRYLHDENDPASIADNRVRAIFEDSKGNFWVGSLGDGLHIMDREKGTFKHYYYDANHPDRLSRPPQLLSSQGTPEDHISFITEDANGMILIGSFFQGINYFNPVNSTLKHYGPIFNNKNEIIKGDTATGLKSGELFKIFHSRDGLMWIPTLAGELYTAQPVHNDFSYYTLNVKEPDVNALYYEPQGNFLWAGTDQGLFRKDLQTGAMKVWLHNPRNAESICNDTILSIQPDDDGKMWMATNNGLTLFDPILNTFKVWKNDRGNPSSLHSNSLNYVFIDKQKTIWIGFTNAGIDKMDLETETFTNFSHEKNNARSLCNNYVYQICEDQNGYIWIATGYGLDKLDKKDGTIYHYIPNQRVPTVIMDKKGIIWASSFFKSVVWYDSVSNNFLAFKDVSLKKEINRVINIIEDKQGNLWCTQLKAIVRIDEKRENVKIYDERSGIHENKFGNANNYVTDQGELFLGDHSGYYHFSPALLKDNNLSISVMFTGFSIGDKEVIPGKQQPITIPISDAQEIKLDYHQNNFSLDFTAINYMMQGAMKYLFKLENYDKDWHNAGTEHKAYFYNIPPGNYVLWIKAISEDGAVGERKIIVTITPPWWRTWWAYTLFAIGFIALIWAFIYYRSHQLILQKRQLEDKVTVRTRELKAEKEKVEVALTELKSTQHQLIQSEKMASLGQLTAGLAHEIQNPLNFVNNFSEVNSELINELVDEVDKGNSEEAKIIANDIKQNLEKINHHGKRADGIVKGMLQHSRSGSGQKELTAINALADEYIRLSYHGIRAEDKNFNATIKIDFDESIGKIDIIPQDIGRVFLNLYNNAFYAVNKKKNASPGLASNLYEPTVSLSTKKEANHVNISVKDNGNGIPQNIVDKIFQPFFTTKPTGQGTGLGLSLAYDIVKAHGGKINVNSIEGKYAEFVVTLPC